MAFPGTLGRSIAVAFFALFGVVAAFAAIAPGREAAEALPATSLVVEPLSLQAREVPLVSFLERLGLDDSAIARLARSPALRALRPGAQVRADFSADGTPSTISFLTGRDTLVKIQPQGDGFRTTEEQASLETRVTMKA